MMILLLAVAPWAQAGKDYNAELKSAQQALTAGDYKLAYARYLRYGKDNPLAQFILGQFQRNGWGRAVDEVAACNWYAKAAQRKIPAAQHFYGDCLRQGTGRVVDVQAALAEYREAAAGGHVISLCSAAELYIRGEGVVRNVEQGLVLCTQAAQANSPPAMLKMAHYYHDDQDVPQNLLAARYWYQHAAEFRVPEAQYQLGVMLSEGKGGEPNVGQALFWLETAATAGYASAYLPVAILYANAELDPQTMALRPEHLAKIYLWNSAAKTRASELAQQAEIARIADMVAKIMPASWKLELDKRVAEHLTKYSPDN